MIRAIEIGAEDFVSEGEDYIIYTKPEDFINIKEKLNLKDNDIITSEVEYIASNYINLDEDQKEKIYELIEILEDNDDVQSVYHNMED